MRAERLPHGSSCCSIKSRRLPKLADHLAFLLQPSLVLRRIAQHELAPSHETVAESAIAALLAEHRARHDAAAVQHHQPVHRPRELRVGVAPAHQLRDRQGLDALHDDPLEMPIERLPGLSGAEDEVLRLAVGLAFERLGRHAAGAREAEQRLGRLAFGVESGGDGRTLALDRALRLHVADPR